MTQTIESRLAEHAEVIRTLGKRALRDIIEIGRHLTEAKMLAGHGAWLQWLRREFGWSEMTARRYMRVFEFFEFEGQLKNNKLLDSSLNLSTLYELNRKTTPPEVITYFIAKAARGEKVTVSEIKEAAGIIPFPKREPPPAPNFPPVVMPPEVTRHDVPLAVMPDHSPASADWTLLLRLENVANYFRCIESTPDLVGAVRGLIENGYLEDITRAAEASSALAARLTAAIAAASTAPAPARKTR